MKDPRSPESKPTGWINLATIDCNVPCPTCGTIVSEIRNKRINQVYSRSQRRKNKFWVCKICTQLLVDPPKQIVKQQKKKDSKPRGWALKNKFVDKNGTYYQKGKEIPELKGKYPPTDTKTTTKNKKKSTISKRDKIQIKNTASIVISNLKKQLDNETRKTKIKELEKDITMLSKLMTGWPSNSKKIIQKYDLLH